MDRVEPQSGTVEELVAAVREAAKTPCDVFLLWVPDQLTLGADAVAHDVGLAVVLDAALAVGFLPDGFTVGPTGWRRYRYVREPGADIATVNSRRDR